MAIFETVLKSDLKKPVQVKQLSGNLFSGDNQGNKITVEVMDNGSPATLSGGVTGYVIREDNSTVIISSGTLSGNKASIVLPEEAYNVVGRVSIVVKVGTVTVGACTAFVYRTSTDTLVDPTGAIPSLQELLAKISACEQATADANKIANLTVSAEAATGSTPDAVLSETGSPAHKHITFKLVKGDKGDTGNTGATPQLSIGTVITLQPSQDATVTITGTDEEPVLNFGIPQGASGNETIDDTAGIGDTDLVYSADKVRKELDAKAPAVDVPLTTPASVQSFPDGADGLPMALTVGIEPVQDLHGYENPWPAGGGKNLLSMTVEWLKTHNTAGTWSGNTYTHNGVAYTIQTDAANNVIGIKASGTSSSLSLFDTGSLIADGSTYYTSGCPSGGGGAIYQLQFIDNTTGQYLEVADTGSGCTLESTSAHTYYLEIVVRQGKTAPTASFLPMVSKTQGGSFAPYSNICPISGWTGAKVTRTGKNLINIPAVATNTFTFYRDEDGNISAATPNSDWRTYGYSNSQYYFTLKAGSYKIVIQTVTVKSSDCSLQMYSKIGDTLVNISNPFITIGTSTYSFTLTKETELAIMVKQYSAVYKMMIVNSDITDYEYEPFGQEYSLTFPSSAGTVYGGTLTVNKDGTGTLVVDRGIVDLGDMSWTVADGYTPIKFFKTTDTIPLAKAITSNADNYTYGICSMYETGASPTYIYGNKTKNLLALDNGKQIRVSRPNDVSASDFKATVTGQKFVYELATPVTYSLTPGQVKTLLGVNNLFADCGNITEVRYPSDTKLYVDQQIADKISASQRLMELIVTANHEDEMKATKAYSTGDLLIVNGTLYKATTSIANGANLTVNTNVTETTVAAELAALV